MAALMAAALKDLPWHAATWPRIAPLWSRGTHAVLLHGMAGIGKKNLALDVAAGLLCERPGAAGQPCRQCASCHWFEAGNHPDARVIVPDALAEFRPASAEVESEGEEAGAEAEGGADKARRRREIVLDQVRGLNDFVSISTHRGGRRVAVVMPAEDLRVEAANRLLKLLEEPPPSSVFLLTTDALDAVLPTIRSRCVLVRVNAPSDAEAAQWLAAQGMADAANALAFHGGGPLAALAQASEEADAARLTLYPLLEQGPRLTPGAIAAAIGKDVAWPEALDVLLRWSYDLHRVARSMSLRYHPSRRSALMALGSRCSIPALHEWSRGLLQARRTATHPLNARMAIEAALLDYRCVFAA
jgi:DNA polymerase-3 subunit delta'